MYPNLELLFHLSCLLNPDVDIPDSEIHFEAETDR